MSVKTYSLKKLGYKSADGKYIVVDGDFGANTEYALKKFQKDKGLVVYGIAGSRTFAALL